jgi:hypothetical protein
VQESSAETAGSLTQLLAGEFGTLATAASVQQCFALLFKSHDDLFPSAHTVALSLLRSVRVQLALLSRPAPTETPRGCRESTASWHTPIGRKLGACRSLAAPAALAPPVTEEARRKGLAESEAALQLLSILAAERPTVLSGMVAKVLSTAFPIRPMAGLELAQKWALDIVYGMSLNSTTAAEVRSMDPDLFLTACTIRTCVSHQCCISWGTCLLFAGSHPQQTTLTSQDRCAELDDCAAVGRTTKYFRMAAHAQCHERFLCRVPVAALDPAHMYDAQ